MSASDQTFRHDDELSQLVRYIQRYPLPTRKSSEARHDAPPKPLAYSATRQMRKDIEATYSGMGAYFTRLFDAQTMLQVLQQYIAEGRIPPLVELSEIVQRRVSPQHPQLVADDFLVVDESDSDTTTIAAVIAHYGADSIPGLFGAMSELFSRITGLPLHESVRVIVNHTERMFGEIHAAFEHYAAQGRGHNIALRIAISEYAQRFVSDCQRISEKLTQGEGLNVAEREIFKPLYSQVKKVNVHDMLALPLARTDAEGLTKVYSAQRRPYTEAELQQANLVLSHNIVLKQTLMIYHGFLVRYARDYLAGHPERIRESVLHYDSLFLTEVLEGGGFSIGPNLRFLSTLASNMVGAVVRIVNQRDGNIELILSEDITAGIQLAHQLGAFKMSIPKLNAAPESETVYWGSNMQQICPAEKMVTQSAVTIVPVVYKSLVEQSSSN